MNSLATLAAFGCVLGLLTGEARAQNQSQCNNHADCSASTYCNSAGTCYDCNNCIALQDTKDGLDCPAKCGGFSADCQASIRSNKKDLPTGCPCILKLGSTALYTTSESYCESNQCDGTVDVNGEAWTTCNAFECDAGCVVGIIISIMCCCACCAGIAFFFFFAAKSGGANSNQENYMGGVATVPAQPNAYSNNVAPPPSYPAAPGGGAGAPPAYPSSDPIVF